MNRPRPEQSRGDARWLTSALREQADEHEPDLGRIQAEVRRLTAGHPESAAPARRSRPARRWLVGVPLGAATAAVAGVTVVIFGVGGGHNGHLSSQTVAPSDSQDSTSRTHRPTSQPTSTAARPAHPPTAASTSDQPSATRAPGPLTARGSVDPHSTQYWAQENLTVATTRSTRALHVIVTVSGGPAVQSTGSWTTITPADLTITTVTRTNAGLTYDITLKPGLTLPASTYHFGIQFNRPAAGHDFTADTYRVSATTADNNGASATGTF